MINQNKQNQSGFKSLTGAWCYKKSVIDIKHILLLRTMLYCYLMLPEMCDT